LWKSPENGIESGIKKIDPKYRKLLRQMKKDGKKSRTRMYAVK